MQSTDIAIFTLADNSEKITILTAVLLLRFGKADGDHKSLCSSGAVIAGNADLNQTKSPRLGWKHELKNGKSV
jgi:hypothetical protein